MKIVFSRKGFDSANDPSLFVGNGDRFTLTAPGSRSRSRWRLPSWFYPSGGCPFLDHHYNRKLWRRSKPRVYLDTVDIGQEFVLEADRVTEANVWLRELFDNSRASRRSE